MDDTLNCPICGLKLKNRNFPNKNLSLINKTANYVERYCSIGHNHTVSFFVDEETKKVDLLRTSLNHKYSRFVDIDFFNGKSRISCFRNNVPEYIEVPKILTPDFPELLSLKEKVNLFVAFL